eukprot:comp21956_c0_seq1/m.50127 comp21956_c0_seq1/g.50127  ORF comp21956_c0_seq1/g.50127 comp21956_c0_seq1/m.50127 type:complete len:536 (-) comp21956_c0_seq1:299-1906(-)
MGDRLELGNPARRQHIAQLLCTFGRQLLVLDKIVNQLQRRRVARKHAIDPHLRRALRTFERHNKILAVERNFLLFKLVNHIARLERTILGRTRGKHRRRVAAGNLLLLGRRPCANGHTRGRLGVRLLAKHLEPHQSFFEILDAAVVHIRPLDDAVELELRVLCALGDCFGGKTLAEKLKLDLHRLEPRVNPARKWNLNLEIQRLAQQLLALLNIQLRVLRALGVARVDLDLQQTLVLALEIANRHRIVKLEPKCKRLQIHARKPELDCRIRLPERILFLLHLGDIFARLELVKHFAEEIVAVQELFRVPVPHCTRAGVRHHNNNLGLELVPLRTIEHLDLKRNILAQILRDRVGFRNQRNKLHNLVRQQRLLALGLRQLGQIGALHRKSLHHCNLLLCFLPCHCRVWQIFRKLLLGIHKHKEIVAAKEHTVVVVQIMHLGPEILAIQHHLGAIQRRDCDLAALVAQHGMLLADRQTRKRDIGRRRRVLAPNSDIFALDKPAHHPRERWVLVDVHKMRHRGQLFVFFALLVVGLAE